MSLVTASVLSPNDRSYRDGAAATRIDEDCGFLAVAATTEPGLDGHAAANLVLDVVHRHLVQHADVLDQFRANPQRAERKQVLTLLRDLFARAAKEAFGLAQRHNDVAIELDVALLLEPEAFVGHVGRGRVYLVRRGVVHQLTVDHGNAGPPGALGEAHRRDYSRALGPEPRARIESLCMEILPQDRFAVIAQALIGEVGESALHRQLATERLTDLSGTLLQANQRAPIAAALAQLGTGDAFSADAAARRLAALAPIPLFAQCTERELRTIAMATRPRRFPADAVIFEQGEEGDELFLVVDGQVEVIKDGRTIVELGPGSNFGEMAMLDEPARSATVVATQQTELLVIPRDAFFALLRGDATLAAKILWNLTLRLSGHLRRTSTQLAAVERELAELRMRRPLGAGS